MTRLTENDIQHIRRRMALHDEELTSQTGYGLAGLAMLAAGGDSRFLKRLHTARVGIIPLTTGQGIIGGFSDSVEAILSYIGMDCFVTDQPDAAGMAEAVERGAGQIFIADDLTCTMIDLHAHCSVENSACTGRAFAAALAARAGDLHHRSVTVFGAGVVGREGAEFLRGRGADIVIYDCDPARTEAFRGRSHFYLAGSLDEALASYSNCRFFRARRRSSPRRESPAVYRRLSWRVMRSRSFTIRWNSALRRWLVHCRPKRHCTFLTKTKK